MDRGKLWRAGKKKKQYLIPCRWEFRGEAIIEASSPEEAVLLFEALQDVEFLDSAAEMINWEVAGRPKLNE